MGRNWRPKYKVECDTCGWKGKRADVTGKRCPKCCGWCTVRKVEATR